MAKNLNGRYVILLFSQNFQFLNIFNNQKEKEKYQLHTYFSIWISIYSVQFSYLTIDLLQCLSNFQKK